MPFLDIFSRKETIKEKLIEKPKIIVDIREKNSLVASELMSLGCDIEFKHLEVGDYISGNTIIERKAYSDFIGSMINKRLLRQLENLQILENKFIIIEGEPDNQYSNMHENSIKGFMLSIILGYKVPIIFSKDYEETAKFISILAKKKPNEISLKLKRKSRDVNEQMQFIIEGFPGIGPKSAKKLLNEFKNIKNIINASEEDLKKVIGIKAEIFKIINLKYKD